MTTERLIEAADLQARLDDPSLLIIDMCKAEQYAQAHIPGAIHLEYGLIVAKRGSTLGLLPDITELQKILNHHGISPDKQIIAYDMEGGGMAARLLWTLEACGFDKLTMLDGGIHAWANEGHPLQAETNLPQASNVEVAYVRPEVIANREYIQKNLENKNVILLDSRSPEEYNGTQVRAARGGHIPGAVNFDWINAMDKERNVRLKNHEQLKQALAALGVTADKEVITYCHSHHRSALTYYMLKVLGFDRVRGYHGSWSDWGNQTDTPITQ